jgi:two-component system OmpR family response regulator
MTAANGIIVVDDDTSIRDALAGYLTRHGYVVRVAENGIGLDALLACETPALVVLDVMLPGEDGLSICRRLSAGGIPVLMLSALGDVTDRVVGLELGASDYLTKPFDPRELLARIRVLLRRTIDPEPRPAGYRFAGWTFDPDARTLRDPTGSVITLPAGETALLRAFVERPYRLLSRDQLLDLARGSDANSYDRAIDLAVSRLRRRLEPAGASLLIETVRGEGYRFIGKVDRP